MSEIDRIGFAGIGTMGGAFAANPVKSGFDVVGFDPFPSACDAESVAGAAYDRAPETGPGDNDRSDRYNVVAAELRRSMGAGLKVATLVSDTLEVRIWRGGADGGLVRYDVPRQAGQTVLDVVTWVQRNDGQWSPALDVPHACRQSDRRRFTDNRAARKCAGGKEPCGGYDALLREVAKRSRTLRRRCDPARRLRPNQAGFTRRAQGERARGVHRLRSPLLRVRRSESAQGVPRPGGIEPGPDRFQR